MMILLDLLYALLTLALAPWLLYRMIFLRRYRTGWKERFGLLPLRSSPQPCLWVHAVSMGEINAIATLVAEIHRVLPQFEIVISTTTDTGMNRARQLYGDKHRVFFFPWDFSFAVRRALKRIHPQLCILMELEVWHNFTRIARQNNIPVVVANGRISSAKGFPRYKKIAPLVRPMFQKLSLVLAQEESYAQRFRYLGVPAEKVKVVGTLKYDTAEITDAVAGSGELAQALHLTGKALWVAGSTGPGEEDIILQSHQALQKSPSGKTLRLAIIPRKPERFDEVAGLIAARGFKLVRYSKVKSGQITIDQLDEQTIILGDTMGDLRKFYSLATVIFVGRSLVPQGGSDMMEAAALAKPTLVGPYTENFTETVQSLVAGQGIEIVADGLQLTTTVQKLLSDPAYARQRAQNARQVIQQNRGATLRTVAHLAALLSYQMPPSPGSIATLVPR